MIDPPPVVLPIGTPLSVAQKTLVVATLTACGGKKVRAAKLLGINLKTLYNMLHRWGLPI